ncbi:ubiquitin-like modifier-activating enzyme 1 [Cherax quadricarinatus]|nr:ubiquitin-like modifier-activating enzyme 1 [Cherax quadricarinatus]XP_053627089.1 ubiquitin-like modifier-activating enzyme 1 [Cherax quadricarinatus]XP_053627090.1 ubiquitin-like modifier-activating enzyme 1 [Cherax quadricarinatus]XP_053627091.1 ubiquitin-like modifier-activating enzyme 1 [Cherax quadricarinatus]XP_053627092.1 ubiquitin-like modifier-activating enzyme 1 [Cherax quadricarinatus]XP_053627093.1 ubiquitin-like modifier-activating enzyme 1 [Cherax quadricarinatus]XP_05362709
MSKEVDETLYSRQLYVLGHQAMQKMSTSDVLVCGLGGLGVEIAKNIILSGVRSVTLHDTTTVTWRDLTTQYFLRASDLTKNRALACCLRLAELNSYVSVSASVSEVTQEFLQGYSVVVLTDTDLEEQVRVSQECRRLGISFLSAATYGVFGQLFCDFGKSFTAEDVDGREPASLRVADITREEEGVVTCIVNQRLGLRDGDLVTFSNIKGMTQLNHCSPTEVKVLNPSSFAIGDTRSFSEYEGGGVVTQVKVPKTFNFKSLEESLAAPTFVVVDELKSGRSQVLHIAFQALHQYVKKAGALPRPWNDEDANKFLECFYDVNNTNPAKVEDVNENILRIFSKVASGTLAPMNSVIGSIASQEVIKACSGKFTPVFQWLYFDAVECLPDDPLQFPPKDVSSRDNRYDAQVAVFGRQLQDKLGGLKLFVVGAGAIGCELLKNLAMIGVSVAMGGNITLTDMDHIEKSNLNRQFLFRPWDIKKSKATTAAAAVIVMNPEVNITPHQVRVGPEAENIYSPEFYKNLDIVANALDNLEARQYMDRRCWYYRKPMLESGTLGIKGSVQVVLPHLTDRFPAHLSSRDGDIPLCTLRSFPNCIEHTLQWARDMFEGEFCHSPEITRQYLEDNDFLKRSSKLSDYDYQSILRNLKSSLEDDAPHNFSDCIAWARRHWETNFRNQIVQLLEYFPPNYVTSTGSHFWSGSKRCPHPLKYDAENPLHLDYVVSAANLRAQVYGIPQDRDRLRISQLAAAVKIPEYLPQVRSEPNDEDAEASIESGFFQKVYISSLQDAIAPKEHFQHLKITPLTFEKDDNTNFHMDFVVAASNLRAENYEIDPADKHKSKKIAGKIVPAIATSTALVAGLVSLELLKVAQGHKHIRFYRNMSFNMAIPCFVLSQPDPPPEYEYNGVKWTTWERFEVDGDMTIQQFLDLFWTKHSLTVTLVARGNLTLYSNLFNQSDRSRRLGQTVTEILEELGEACQEPLSRTLMLDIGANDTDGAFVTVPHVEYKIQHT